MTSKTKKEENPFDELIELNQKFFESLEKKINNLMLENYGIKD